VQNFSGFKYFPRSSRDGRASLGLTDRRTNTMAKIAVNRAVHILFNDPDLVDFKPNYTVDHIDRNPSNNDHSNLRWLDKSGQRKNQNNHSEYIPTFRYRASNGKLSIDFSERLNIAEYIEVNIDMIPVGCIDYDSLLLNEWSVHTLDNSFIIEGEQWKDITGSRLSVSSFGRVQKKQGSVVRRYYPRIEENGYCRLKINGKKRQLSHIIAFAFGLERLSGQHEVDHIDKNTGNNSIENLRWVTTIENAANRSELSLKPIASLEVKAVGSKEWIMIEGGTRELTEKLGIKAQHANSAADPNKRNQTALGSDRVRYYVRKAHDPSQDDLEGEEWKELRIEDWSSNGKYKYSGLDDDELEDN